MPTFGSSAFLKLVCLSAKRQRSAIAERLRGSRGSGYDFHRAMRSICSGYLVGGVALEDSFLAARAIVQEPERKSAIAALDRIVAWRAEHPAPLTRVEARTYESPAGIFKVRFDPDFGVSIGGSRVAVHVWNTKFPPLDARLTRGVLSLFSGLYDEGDADDLAVLNLRNGQLVRLSEDEDASEIGINIVEAIDRIFEDLRPEGPRPGVDERPSA